MKKHNMKMHGPLALGLLLVCVLTLSSSAQSPFGRGRNRGPSDEFNIFASRGGLAEQLPWRELGPVNHSGRIVDIAVHPKDRSIFYVASASGGLWKTTGRGLEFISVFKQEGQTSIGCVTIDPSKPDTIWVGTGEANNQRSSYHGDGVYKSTDGGKTWKNMGLLDSHHIGRIVVDPNNSEHVLVAALGHLYTPNEERGLYRSVNGGKTWKKVIDAGVDVGCVDVAMQPGNSQVVLASTYERRRRAWDFDGSGKGSKLWRSTDGGATFSVVKAGLPTGEIGRIGIAFAPSAPNITYLTLENANRQRQAKRRKVSPLADGGSSVKYEDEDLREFFGEEDEAREAEEAVQGRGQRGRRGRGGQRGRSRRVGGEVYKSTDGGKSWKKTNQRSVGGSPAYYYGQIRVDPGDATKVYVLSVPLYVSSDGGKTFSRNGARNVHVDHHALWIDPRDSTHLLLGNDGGLCESYDRGKTWIHYENLPVGQYYAVAVDKRKPYRVFGGTQDNGSWGLPSAGPLSSGPRLIDAFKVYSGDGFYVEVDPEDPNTIYAESQFGGLGRVNLKTMQRKSIKPRPKRGELAYRFNWMSPVVISQHNHTTIYFGGNRLFKSLNRGDKWKVISPDLTTKNKKKLAGNVPHCTITTISESPLRAGLLWVGTDDGKLWLSADDGRSWKDLSSGIPRKVRGLWVSRVDASHFEEGRCYVSYTGYREDQFEPHVFVTEDYGLTFMSISGDLPDNEAINVVREDPRDPDIVYVGSEGGAYVTVERGGRWRRLGKGLPRVAVHDLIVHPEEPDVIVGTHGRGIHILDVSALEQWKTSRVATGSFLMKPRDIQRFPRGPGRGYTSPVRVWKAGSGSGLVDLCAYLDAGVKKAELQVVDGQGKVLKHFKLEAEQGLHQVRWNMLTTATSTVRNVARNMQRFFRGRGRRRGFGMLGKGSYRVELLVDGKKQVERLNVR